jgi:hypothetical protein
MQRADKRQYHYIYKITRFDGRYYIGMHSTDDLEDGYFGSGKLITRSVKRHGVDRHTKQILEMLPSRQELRSREEQLVNEELLSDPLCMNIITGGGGNSSEDSKRFWLQHPEWRLAASERAKKLWQDPVYRAKLLKSLSEQSPSQQRRDSISRHAKDRWASMTDAQRDEICSKIGAASKARGNGWKDKKHSDASKAKMGVSAKRRPSRGPLSAETCDKIGESNRLKQSQPCTVDGITIFPSRRALVKELGQGKNGSRSSTFRFLDTL